MFIMNVKNFLSIVGSSVNNERMTVALEELQDLRGVWSSLSKIWTQIDDIREKPWLSVQPRKLRYISTTIRHNIYLCFSLTDFKL